MNFHLIHITGASGSGTTTPGAALALRLGYRHLDADDYYWELTHPPYRVKREKDRRLHRLREAMESSERNVLSGSICGWGAALEDSFDLIIYLRIPPDVRLARLRAREIIRHGKVNDEFIAWAALYDEGDASVRSRARHEQWLACRTCPILRLEGDMTVEDRIAAVKKLMKPRGAQM